MALSKQKKAETIEKLRKALKDAMSIVFVNFKGLSAGESMSMRRALRASGVGYMVVKKTLAKLALSPEKYEGEEPEIAGELAVAYGADSLAPAREIHQFEKKLEGKVKIAGGIFERSYRTRDFMEEIASIPPLPVLYGQFVNLVNSPIVGFVRVLDAIVKQKT